MKTGFLLQIAMKAASKYACRIGYFMRKILRFTLHYSLFTVHCSLAATAQDFSGYLSGMPSVIVQQPGGDVWWQGLAHNRLNFGLRIADFWRIDAGVRNRLMTGSEAMLSPENVGADKAWADLSWNWASGRQVVGNTAFDRFYLTFEKEKWKLQLGRQRINWGQTFVWNPNDIFNTYSFFDFDYVERSGSDAFRLTYFHNETASTELAASVNHEGKTTAALLHHWNWRNFDYQLIAGEQTEEDFVVGGAWSGDFKGLNFRGELSCFRPFRNFADTSSIIALSVGLDYMFSNSLMLQTEVLYNKTNATADNSLLGLYSAPMSAKNLSICDLTLFGQASYPITPRLNSSLSAMYFVEIKTYYTGLTFDFSLADNLDLSGIVQYFSTLPRSRLGNMRFMMSFARLKWNF